MRRFASRHRNEDGVIAVFVAIVTCFTLVPLAAFAVDIGVQRVATRDMQALADVVALDLARELNGRTYSQLQGNLQSWADASAARNQGVGSARTVRAELGTIDKSRYSTTDSNAIFQPMTSDSSGVAPNAVRVTASTSVDFSIEGGSGGATRTAIAAAVSQACFKLGSFALAVNSGNSALLNGLIGDALNLGVLSYHGLASANISLLGLATELGAGTTDELLALDNLSLNDLYLASARALAKQGGSAANVALLNQLATASFGSLPHLAISDLIALEPGNDAALQTSVNLLDLVAGSAFIANGENALAIPDIKAGIPGIATVSGALKIIEAPKPACNLGSAQTAQVKLDLTIKLQPLTLFNVLLVGAVTADATMLVHVDLASASGTLRSVQCGPGRPDGMDVDVASSLSQMGVSFNPFDVKLLGVPVVKITGGSGTTAAAANQTVQIRIPPNSYNSPVSSGSGTILPGVSTSDLHPVLLGAVDLSAVMSAVSNLILTPIVNPLIANINTKLLTPLTDLLGVNLGGADVFAMNPIKCGDVSLAG